MCDTSIKTFNNTLTHPQRLLERLIYAERNRTR